MSTEPDPEPLTDADRLQRRFFEVVERLDDPKMGNPKYGMDRRAIESELRFVAVEAIQKLRAATPSSVTPHEPWCRKSVGWDDAGSGPDCNCRPSSVTPDLRAAVTVDPAMIEAWLDGHRQGIGCGHDLAVCRHDDAAVASDVDDLASWNEKARAALASVTPSEPTLDAAGLIAAERKRQIEAEGYDAAHDAGHADELAMAAAVYATPPDQRQVASGTDDTPIGWPWERRYYKPDPTWSTDGRIRELVKAGALIAAAIDDLSRGGPA